MAAKFWPISELELMSRDRPFISQRIDALMETNSFRLQVKRSDIREVVVWNPALLPNRARGHNCSKDMLESQTMEPVPNTDAC
jgi:hypothetical protein